MTIDKWQNVYMHTKVLILYQSMRHRISLKSTRFHMESVYYNKYRRDEGN